MQYSCAGSTHHMTVLDITIFSGHLHPLIVHLPIGFILLGVVFEIASYSKKYANLKPGVSVALLMAFVSAVLACVFGYVLSLSGEYDQETLRQHKFSGIILAIILGILYIIKTSYSLRIREKLFTAILLGLTILLAYGGHLGASLTHGNDYLTIKTLMEKEREKPSSIDEAMIFEDVVQPILKNKCSQCHREGKSKGRLSVESLQTLVKGGKNGPAIIAGKPGESGLYKRVTLDPDNKDFMPKDGKAPLTRSEIKIIKWWIEKGNAVSGKKILELTNTDPVKPLVGSYLGMGGTGSAGEEEAAFNQPVNPDIPAHIDTIHISELRKKGFMVRFMLKAPVMLDITLPARSGIKATDFKDHILPLAKNIIWLNLSSNNFTDTDLSFLNSFTNLEKLRLENNPLTDQISNSLATLKHLESVNLNRTKVTDAAIVNLKKNTAVKRIYTLETAAAQGN